MILGVVLLSGCSVLRRPASDLAQIPDQDEYGEPFTLETRICRPGTASPAPILVLNHGAPAGGSTREDIRPPECASPAVRWFASRGYLVVLPMRRGYGRSGGDWSEDPGPCASPDYLQAARAGAHDIALALAYAQALPGARPDGPVVLGWDTGGLAALAYAAGNPPLGTRGDRHGADGGRARKVRRPGMSAVRTSWSTPSGSSAPRRAFQLCGSRPRMTAWLRPSCRAP